MAEQRRLAAFFDGWSWSPDYELFTEDVTYAECNDDVMGGRAILTGFNFSIPSAPTGFKVEWKGYKDISGSIVPSSLMLLNGGVETGDDRYPEIPDLTTSPAVYSVGGMGQTWNFPDLTTTAINAGDFGVVFHIFPQSGQILYLDYIAITVYYEESIPSQSRKTNLIGLSPTMKLKGKLKPII